MLKLRMSEGKPFITDNGNHICDASFGRIDDPQYLALVLSSVPGVVDHGLFIGIASLAIIVAQTGIETLEPKA